MAVPIENHYLSISFDRVSVYNSVPHTCYGYLPHSDSYYCSLSPSADLVDNPVNRQHSGTLSLSAMKNLLTCVEKFVYYTSRVNAIKKKRHLKGKRTLKFVTLSLSAAQVHSDVEIKESCLNQFLTELRTSYNMKHYIWKAEKQKNGNLHFHLIIDVYIHYSVIREIWNRCQNKLNYVKKYTAFFSSLNFDQYKTLVISQSPSRTEQQIFKAWQKGQGCNWESPPSTEIRNVLRVRSARSYFAKYFSKSSKVDEGFGRIWFASRSLTAELKVVVNFSTCIWDFGNFLKESFPNRFHRYDYASCWFVRFHEYSSLIDNFALKIFRNKFDDIIKDFW